MKLPSLFTALLLICLYNPINPCLADPHQLQDICPTAMLENMTLFINGYPCKIPATVTASDFKTSKLSHAGDTDNFLGSSQNFVTASDFPGLNTQGLSVSRTDFAVNGMVSPHTHPRASEMFYVSKGVLIVGFVDSGNRFFQWTLRDGDVFVFPRGLLHFSLNDGYDLATAFSVFNSQNPGLVSITNAIFTQKSGVLERLARRLLSLSALDFDHIRNVTMDLDENIEPVNGILLDK